MANDLVAVCQAGELDKLPLGNYLYTGDPTDKKQQAALMLAVQGKPLSLAECLNLEIEVVHLLYQRVEIIDSESGEVKQLPRLCLFTKDGKVYSTSGRKAVKDALLPAMLLGFPLPYQPAQRFKITKTKSRPDGGGYINLEWLGVATK